MEDRQIWVYDIEQFKNFHCSTWLNIDTQEIKVFIISIFQNDYEEYRDFCYSGIKGIGFNNLNYDYPMLDYLFTIIGNSPLGKMNEHLYLESQRLVNSETPKFNRIKNPIFDQIDVFTISHFDNAAKRTSLKQLEIVLELENVEDMPYRYDEEITTLEQQEKILSYNYNDVYATYQFFLKVIPKIRLRQNIKDNTNLACINWSDSKIGEHLILHNYCLETGDNPYNINQLRTNRDYVDLKDIIYPIKFETIGLLELYNSLKTVRIWNDEKSNIEEKLEYKVTIKDLELDIKKGGLHGSLKGIFKKSKTHSIIDIDVAGLYPNLYTFLKAVPEHLDSNTFIKVAKALINWRKQNKDIAKTDKNAKSISDTYKLALNSVYGKFKDRFSWLYDIKCTFNVTINGQLFLLKLLEVISTIKDCTIIQANTDGITVYINNKELDNFRNLYKLWEKEFSMELEEVEYQSMYIRDVNNYFSQTVDGKMKYKGAYVPDFKSDSTPDPYHKDYSNQISVLACIDYFINGSDPLTYIKNCQDIRRFSLKERCNRGDTFILHSFDGEKIVKSDVGRTVRFYVAKSYKRLVKQYGKGTSSQIVKGYNIEIINKLPEHFPNNIDYSYYLEEAKKLIDEIEDTRSKKQKQKYKNVNQLNLF
jgi:hypothetical protein